MSSRWPYISLALGLALGALWLALRPAQSQAGDSSDSPTHRQAKSVANSPAIKLSAKATRPGALPGESAGQQGARLFREAADLLNAEPLEELKMLDFKKPEDLERIRQLRQTPEFLRWRQLIRETIACGAVDWGIDWSQGSHTLLPEIGLQRDAISLLSNLSVMETAEGDANCMTLLEASKLSRIMKSPDTLIQQLVASACSGIVNSKVADHLAQSAPEALDRLAESLKEDSKAYSSDCLQSLDGEIQHYLKSALFDHPEELVASFGETKCEAEISQLLKDTRFMTEAKANINQAALQMKNTWEKALTWQERAEAQQAYNQSLREFLQQNASAAAAEKMQDHIASSTTLLGKFLDYEARRQSTLAALQIEQFRRANGRLPATLEEAGWLGYGDATGRAMSYEVKDGKAVITTAQESGQKKSYEVKW